MGPDDEVVLGDVISIGSSSDEEPQPAQQPTRKRPLDEGRDSSRSSQDAGSSLRGAKRARTNKSTRSTAGLGGSSEEGELKDPTGAKKTGGKREQDETASESAQTASGGGQGEIKPQPSHPIDGQSTDHGSFDHEALAYMSPNPSIFRKKLTIPSLSDRSGSWQNRFRHWVQLLRTHNPKQVEGGHLTPDFALSAYNHYLDKESGLKRPKKKSARQAAQAINESGELASRLRVRGAMDGSALGSGGEKQSSERKEAGPAPIQGNGAGTSDEAKATQKVTKSKKSEKQSVGSNGSTKSKSKPTMQKADQNGGLTGSHTAKLESGSALELQRRYFPSANASANMCLMCGREGHTATNCSHLACRFCNGGGHWDFACPSRSRCTKCRQLGHSVADCAEKLALTVDEGLACAFCNAVDHLENTCTLVWRSFHPEQGTINTVVHITASCANCGSSKHFAADCYGCQPGEANPTWSLKNRDRYVDPSCSTFSIEHAVAAKSRPNAAPGPDMKIRGHASRTNNVHYSESDDSDIEFLGSRPMGSKRPPLGQIHVASNIQMPNSARNRGSRPGRVAQGHPAAAPLPPLPPGPPPAGPPPPPGAVASYNALPLAPPPSLPPKPPASARDYRAVPPPPAQTQDSREPGQADMRRGGREQRGGRGGRGSGRGGGRGRSRGRGRGRGN